MNGEYFYELIIIIITIHTAWIQQEGRIVNDRSGSAVLTVTLVINIGGWSEKSYHNVYHYFTTWFYEVSSRMLKG